MKALRCIARALRVESAGRCNSKLLRRSAERNDFHTREKMTQSYEEILKELNMHFATRQQENERNRSLIALRHTQLSTLLQNITQCSNAFDEEDRNTIQEQLLANEQEAQNLETEIAHQDEQRKEQDILFKCMELAIQERSKILERDDECLSSHPQMLQFFARKQVSLQMLLASKMKNSVEAKVS